MLDSAQNLIKQAAKHLNLSEEDTSYLLEANKEHVFEIDVNGKKYPAYRIQHNNALGPYKGGIRFHPLVNLNEVKALAALMMLKTSVVGLPLGGGKGGVAVDPKQLSKADLEELSRKYSAYLAPHIGPDKDVPAPDVNTDAVVIDWMLDEYNRQTGHGTKAAFTGKSVENGGSQGREAATGYGGYIILNRLLELLGAGTENLTYSIQGFGNVGTYFCLSAEEHQPGWRLVAATDSSVGIKSSEGLEANKLDKFKSTGGKFAEYHNAAQINPEEFIGQQTDVLVLAALGDAVTESNMHLVKAKYILELSNGPVNNVAHNYLTKKGVIIIPDIIANAGGVVVSYLEWLQNKNDEQWSEVKVNSKMAEYLVTALDKIYNYSTDKKIPLKEAAIAIAIHRILKARKGE